MNYAIIRVRLPVDKNVKIFQVLATSYGSKLHYCQIQTVRYIRGKTKPTGKAKAVASRRTGKRKAIA